MKKNFQKGFTLIEVMITVAIVGALAAITVQQYLYYVAKAQVAAAVSEISAAKLGIELRLSVDPPRNQSREIQYYDTAASLLTWGIIYPVSSRCKYRVFVLSFSQSAVIECNLLGASPIEGKNMQFTRQVDTEGMDDGWWCRSNLEDKYRPPECTFY
jgi:type IV pilus assembly protein PilA